jgi:phytoene dehydrogenase-like protein
MREEIGRLAPGDLDRWGEYRAHVERFWSDTVGQIMRTPMESVFDLLPFVRGMLSAQGFLSMNDLVQLHLRDRRLVRALRFHPTFVGSSPWTPGSSNCPPKPLIRTRNRVA